MPAPIFLLSDFGLHDPYVGVLRAVIAGLEPAAQIHDLLHEVPAHDVLAARLHLAAALPYLPDGAVLGAIVDPGVGTSRRGVAVEAVATSGRRLVLVAPDNGLLSSLLTDERQPYTSELRVRRAWTLDPKDATGHGPGTTFDGRDLFAPAVARLARGEAPDVLGDPIDPNDLRCEPAPDLTSSDAGVRGRVAWIDRFGDLVSDVPVSPTARIHVRLGSIEVEGPVAAFADVPIGAPLAYVGSWGTVEVALRERSAAAAWEVDIGASIEVRERL